MASAVTSSPEEKSRIFDATAKYEPKIDFVRPEKKADAPESKMKNQRSRVLPKMMAVENERSHAGLNFLQTMAVRTRRAP